MKRNWQAQFGWIFDTLTFPRFSSNCEWKIAKFRGKMYSQSPFVPKFSNKMPYKLDTKHKATHEFNSIFMWQRSPIDDANKTKIVFFTWIKAAHRLIMHTFTINLTVFSHFHASFSMHRVFLCADILCLSYSSVTVK